jgi:hypothetical protein
LPRNTQNIPCKIILQVLWIIPLVGSLSICSNISSDAEPPFFHSS